MAHGRDDFSQITIRELAKRAGYHCSNPDCRKLTVGPAEKDLKKGIVMGEAAHITAASPGGCRFDPILSPELRKDIDNGIWLCSSCAALIDKKCEDYRVEDLKNWKERAEIAARKGLTNPGIFTTGAINANIVMSIFRFKSPSQYFEIDQSKAPPGKAFYIELKLIPFEVTKGMPPITDARIEYVVDSSFGPFPRACVFSLQILNTGKGVETNANIEIHFSDAVIWKIRNHNDDRIESISIPTIKENTNLAGFSINNIKPGECHSIAINTKEPGPFHASCYCTSNPSNTVPYLWDVEFSGPKLGKALPSRTSEFYKKNYPFN